MTSSRRTPIWRRRWKPRSASGSPRSRSGPRLHRTATDREPPDRAACLEIAARYLGPRPRSRWEVHRRLLKAGADDATAEAALSDLERLGFVDDGSFARWWLEQRDRHAPRGRRAIAAELTMRGVPAEVVSGLWQDTGDDRPSSNEPLPASEEERAAAALARYLGDRTVPTDPRGRQKLVAHLVRRGFSASLAWTTVRGLATPDTLEPEDR